MPGIPIPDNYLFFVDLHNITDTIKALNVIRKQITAFDIVPVKKVFELIKIERKSIILVQK